MFLTWQLWNALRFPQRRHPIFKYAHKPPSSRDASSWRGGIVSLLAVASMIIFAILIPIPAIAVLAGVVVSVPLLMILLNGTIFGILWATGISDTIATVYRDNRFELLSLSSQGTYGILWLLCGGVVHRNDRLRTVYRIVRWVVVMMLVLLVIAIVMLIFGTITTDSLHVQQQQLRVLREVIQICLIVSAFWLDHVQSIIVAVMVGTILPAFIKDKIQLRGITPIIYLAIQALTYLTIFTIYALIGVIFRGIFGNTFIVSLIIGLVTLASFFLIRESIIAGLWRVILIKYDISLDEYQHSMTA